MNKDTLKGLIIGCFTTLALALSVPVVAQTTEAITGLNLFRIKSADRTIVNWGQAYALEDGREFPASIVYGGETYLHVDLASEAYNGKTLWNGDSSTLTVVGNSSLGDIVESVTKKDANGNTWTYSIRNITQSTGDDRYYLLITDNERGYERAYQLVSETAYEFAEECVYFSKPLGDGSRGFALAKLPFANTPDNQDGDEIFLHRFMGRTKFSSLIITDGVMYYINHSGNPGIGEYYDIMAVDCEGEDEHKGDLAFLYGEYGRKERTLFSSGYSLDRMIINDVRDGYLFYSLIPVYNPDGSDVDVFAPTKHFKIKIDGTESPIQVE